ncbi:MAG: hypothetical protein PF447_00505, partial [Spirochaetaceae bacterium]|nr:hypothetical protein [Spirochaetaceae bacterium]
SIRNPLEVALSAVNRKTLTDRYIPFSWIKQYKKKGQSYWRWTFTGKEPLFQCFDLEKITLFQWYLLEWIEVENRAMDFLRQYQKDGDCFTLLVPQDLNDPEKMSQMMDFFHLEQRKKNLDFRGKRNRNHCSTLLNDSHRVQFDQLIAAVPKSFLEIFTKPPYSDCPWADLFYTDKE